MAIKYYERYPQRWESPSQDYPQGAFKNLSALGEQDGSYLETSWLNDQSGFFGALLRNAEMTPNGLVDTAQKSQFYEALLAVANKNTESYFSTRTVGSGQYIRESYLQPITISALSANIYGEFGHSHEIDKASLTQAGISQLSSAIDDSEDKAATPKAVNNVKEKADQLPNPILNRFPVGESSTAYRLVDVEEMKTLLNVSEAFDVVQEAGQSITDVISQKGVTDLIYQKSRWHDMTGSKFFGVTYSNTSKREMDVIVQIAFGYDNDDVNVYVDEYLIMPSMDIGVYTTRGPICFTVPQGLTYRITSVGQTTSITKWSERIYG